MRIDSSAYQPERSAHWALWAAAGCRRIPAKAIHRIPPVDRACRFDALCWRRPYLPAVEPYWLSLKRENAWRPGVYPLPYWAVLEYSRRQQEEAARLAAHAIVPAAAGAAGSCPRQPKDPQRSPQAQSPAADFLRRAPESARLPAPRIGEVSGVVLSGPTLGALKAYAGPEPRPATGRLLDVLG